MTEVTSSIVVKRLVRNLRYRLTYIKVFESFFEPQPPPAVVRLLNALVSAQQTAAVPLSGYLKGLGIATEGMLLNQRLLNHASSRNNLRSRLRFIQYGLRRAVSWYKVQLTDRQMTADPELRRLLLELGESGAASLWRTGVVMDILGIRQEPEPKGVRGPSGVEPHQRDRQRSLQPGSSTRPTPSGEQSAIWPRQSRANSDG
jgi:hypothetical protein